MTCIDSSVPSPPAVTLSSVSFECFLQFISPGIASSFPLSRHPTLPFLHFMVPVAAKPSQTVTNSYHPVGLFICVLPVCPLPGLFLNDTRVASGPLRLVVPALPFFCQTHLSAVPGNPIPVARPRSREYHDPQVLYWLWNIMDPSGPV